MQNLPTLLIRLEYALKSLMKKDREKFVTIVETYAAHDEEIDSNDLIVLKKESLENEIKIN